MTASDLHRRGALLLLCYLALAGIGLERPSLPFLLVPWSVAFLALLPFLKGAGSPLSGRTILAWAAAFRLVLLWTNPDLSDDHFRYLWDGLVQIQGENPYRFTPEEAARLGLGDPGLLPLLNSPGFHSVYPPLSQLAFRFPAALLAAYGWETAFRALRALFTLAELLGVALLLRAVRRWGAQGRSAVILYAWNPLAVLAVAGSGHSEALLVPALALLAAGVAEGRRGWAWMGLVGAGLVKLVPFALAPLLLRWSRRGGTGWWLAPSACFGAALLLSLPFAGTGVLGRIGGSLDLYTRLFEFNAGLYFVLKEGLWRLTGEDHGKTLGPLLQVVFLVWTIGVTLLHPLERDRAWFRAAAWILTGYYLTATTVHPWYLLWLLPLLPFARVLPRAWLWASWAAMPTYLTYLGVSHGALTALFWGGWMALAVREGAGPAWHSVLRRAGRRKARKLASYLAKGSVLDVGAGEGWVGGHLADSGARPVILLDRHAFSRSPLSFVQADGARLPFRDRAFDHVLLSLTLHHMADPGAALDEARRVARRSVVVTESCYRSEAGRRLVLAADRLVNRFRGGGGFLEAEPVRLLPAAQWEDLFRRAGLEVVRRTELNRWIHHWVLWELGSGAVGSADPRSPTISRR